MRALLFFGLLIMVVAVVPARGQDGFVAQTGAPLAYNVFDRNGRTFVNPATDVAGTPFYKDNWQIATLVAAGNQRYDSIKIRLNLQSGEVHVLDPNNNELALAKGYIKEVLWPAPIGGVHDTTRFQIGFPAVDLQDANFFYEVVTMGKIWLLHSVRKVIQQQKDDLSGEIRREFRTYEDYYLFDGTTMQRVKKEKAFILAALGDKRDKIGAYIDANKLKVRSVDDIKRIVDYYNTLP